MFRLSKGLSWIFQLRVRITYSLAFMLLGSAFAAQEQQPATAISAEAPASTAAQQAVAVPTFTPGPGVHHGPLTVKLVSATAGAAIRYTTDGTTPSATAGTVYAGPLAVTGKMTVKATAYVTGIAASSVVSATYFVVGPPVVGSVSPASASIGSAITISGTGFGPWRFGGAVWLGTTYGKVLSWSDRKIVAMAALNARSGTARVQAAGAWSNTVPFQLVPHASAALPSGGSHAQVASFAARPMDSTTVTLVPNQLSMLVGGTNTIQALDSNGQPVTGLTWASSNTSVVTLSTDDPPVLTAVAAGQSTITAGSGSANVTVYAGVSLPVGTVIWSNPGDGSGVYSIVPAVPSSSGVADVFAFQGDGTVQAITSDGATAWSADVSQASRVVPDFQGGLVTLNIDYNNGTSSIMKLDGVTGQPYPAYTPNPPSGFSSWPPPLVVHPDGTIFAVGNFSGAGEAVVGIDPTTGTQKFMVSLNIPTDAVGSQWEAPIIAGDGNAYVFYAYGEAVPDPSDDWITVDNHLMLLQVSSSGVSNTLDLVEVNGPYSEVYPCGSDGMITNADTGVMAGWFCMDGSPTGALGLAVTTGTSVNLINGPQMPGQVADATPVLQAEDGSFVGTTEAGDDWDSYMLAFDSSGNLLWDVSGWYQPEIATADGGSIALDIYAGVLDTLDQNGNITGQPPIPSNAVLNWGAQIYAVGTSGVNLNYYWVEVASSSAAVSDGCPSGYGTYIANRGLIESVPLWDIAAMVTMPPSCTLGSSKPNLSGAAAEKYMTANTDLQAFLKFPPTNTCANFFQSIPGPAYNQLLPAVIGQKAYDGIGATISQFNAGAYSRIPNPPKQGQILFAQNHPMCSLFFDAAKLRLVRAAISQTAYPPGTDVYFDTRTSPPLPDLPVPLNLLTPGLILHEALHNLTGLDDKGLYALLTNGKTLGGQPSSVIDMVVLPGQGCTPTQ